MRMRMHIKSENDDAETTEEDEQLQENPLHIYYCMDHRRNKTRIHLKSISMVINILETHAPPQNRTF